MRKFIVRLELETMSGSRKHYDSVPMLESVARKRALEYQQLGYPATIHEVIDPEKPAKKQKKQKTGAQH